MVATPSDLTSISSLWWKGSATCTGYEGAREIGWFGQGKRRKETASEQHLREEGHHVVEVRGGL